MTIISSPGQKTIVRTGSILLSMILTLLFISPLYAEKPADTVSIQLKYFHQFQFAGYYAAVEKGFYTEEGLNVRLKEADLTKPTIQAVLDGTAEYGTADSSLLLQRLQGKPVVLLKQIFQHSPLVLLSLSTSNIISPYEMTGKKVAFNPDKDAPILALFLETLGSLDKIQQVHHGNDYEDLINGKIDVIAGYLTSAPVIYKEQGFETNIINPQNYGIDFYGDNLFTTEEELKHHPERVEKVIRATIKGWEYALDHPQEIIDIIKTKYGSKLSREALTYESRMTGLMILRDLIPMGDINPKRYERIGEVYKRVGMVDDLKVPEGFIYKKLTASKAVTLTNEEREWIKKHPKIILGMAANEEPYIIKNADGTYSGILKDFLDTLNERLGININLNVNKWADLIDKNTLIDTDGILALKDKNADNLGLLKTVDYLTMFPVVYTIKDADIHGLEDLKSKKIAFRKGNYYSEEIIKPYLNDIDVIRVDDNLEALQLVYERKADAMIGLSNNNFLISKYHLTGLAPSFIIWNCPFKVVMGIRSDWPELVNILNKGINSFTEDEMNGFVSRWYTLPIKPLDIKLDSSEKSFLLSNSVIKVAIDPYWEPIEYIDESGNPQGISVDYLKKIMAFLNNQSFEYVRGDSWPDLLSMADKGKVDLFMALSRTDEKEKELRFSRPYISIPVMIYANKDASHLVDLKELNNRKVSVVSGYALDEWLARDYPGINLLKAQNIHEALSALQSGDVDAFIDNILSVNYHISQYGYTNLKIIGETPYSYDLCFAARNDLAQLVPIIQKVLDSIPESEKSEIRKKWITIGYEHTFDYSLLWKGAAGAIALFVLFILWNRYLARVIEKRTKALELSNRIVSNTSIGTAVFQSSGDCIMANEAAAVQVGGTVEELLRQNFRKVRDWQENGLLYLAEKALESEKEQTGEITTITTFDKAVTLYCRFIPFRFKDEKHLMLMFEDITDRKRAEEEKIALENRLQQAQKMESIGTLAGGVAHDFNNILSPIMLHAEMIMEDLPSDDPLQQDVNEIYKAGKRARELVQQILTFARKKPEEKIVLRSSLIIKEAVKFLRSTIPATIDVQYEIKTDQDRILADPTQINQIVMNLCTNAAHAMRQKGGILKIILDNEDIVEERINGVFIFKPGKYLKLSVRDNGKGIPPEDMHRIFEPYYTTKNIGEGTGLGLAIIHGIVQNYGGNIELESEVGKGTTFHIYLPLIESETQIIDTQDLNIPKGTENILIVDDEGAILNALKKMLERLGYNVTAGIKAIEILNIFRNDPKAFDLVISDMTMPYMTGKELAGELKKIRPDIPVILCTGFSDQINEKEAKTLGIDAFILKPIIRMEIANIIRDVLNNKK